MEYTLPGVLHFLQTTHRNNERERNEREIERTDLKARIAYLEGEALAQERIQSDLVKRVKMLEFVLKKERSKSGDTTAPAIEATVPPAASSSNPKLMNFSKGFGHMRSTELLKRHQVGYLVSDEKSEVASVPPSVTTATLPPKAKPLIVSENLAVIPKLQLEVKNELTNIARQDPKTVWKAINTLKSHFDAVRATKIFGKSLFTASEDHTVKIWDFTAAKDSARECEPIATYRGHSGPVTCIDSCTSTSLLYTGSVDSSIRSWSIPDMSRNTYDSFESMNQSEFIGHSDIIWDLIVHPVDQILVSCSSDGNASSTYNEQGTLKIWNTSISSLLHTIRDVKPTCLAWSSDHSKIIVGTTELKLNYYDIVTQQLISSVVQSASINAVSVLDHQVYTGLEDHKINVVDLKSNTAVRIFNAHTESVSALTNDGQYLISAGQDASVRWWDLNAFACTQELTVHQKVGDNGVWSVDVCDGFVVSGGADACAKIYTKC